MAPLIVENPENDAFSASRFSLPMRSQLMEQESCQPKRRRKLKFGGHVVINRDPEYYDEDDVAIKWWTSEELQVIRQDAKAIAEDLRGKSASNPSSCYISLAHRKTSLMLASDFKSLMKLSRSTPDQDLHQWCSWNDGRRGLERFSSQNYWCFRRRDIASFRKGVIEEMMRQKEAGISDPEIIGKLAREASRRPRTFALFLGGADALEASCIQDEPVPVRRAPPRKRSKTDH